MKDMKAKTAFPVFPLLPLSSYLLSGPKAAALYPLPKCVSIRLPNGNLGLPHDDLVMFYPLDLVEVYQK